MRFAFMLSETWQGLRRNSTMALSVVIVTFVSLTFVGAAALLQTQVDKLKDDWFDRVEVSIFLCPQVSLEPQCQAGEVTPAERADIERVLTNGALGELVQQVYFESKTEAYEAFLENNGDSIYAQHLTAEDMQSSYRVKLVDPEQFGVIADATSSLPGVEKVEDQREIFRTLFQTLNGATFVAAGLALVMSLAAGLLITTTIRLSALSRRKETTIMRMVGSSKALIQLPFMLEGAFAALLGAVLAITGLWLSAHYLVEQWLAEQSPWVNFVGTQDVLLLAPWLLLISVVLAALASVLTIGRYTNA